MGHWRSGQTGLLGLAPPEIPRLDQVAVDGRVLAFGFAISTGAGSSLGCFRQSLSRTSSANALGSSACGSRWVHKRGTCEAWSSAKGPSRGDRHCQWVWWER